MVTLGRAASAGGVNTPNVFAMLFRNESRQPSIVGGSWASTGFADERFRRSFHLLLFNEDVGCMSMAWPKGLGSGSGSAGGVWIQGTSSPYPDPFRLGSVVEHRAGLARRADIVESR